MRKFELDVIDVNKFAKDLVFYEYNFHVNVANHVFIVEVEDINHFYQFLIDHYDDQITLSDVLDFEKKD